MYMVNICEYAMSSKLGGPLSVANDLNILKVCCFYHRIKKGFRSYSIVIDARTQSFWGQTYALFSECFLVK